MIFDSEQNKNVALECKQFIKYLGILADNNLTWKHHIDHITIKISRTIGLISKLRHLVQKHTLINIYRSLVVPYLSYGLIVWGQARKSCKIRDPGNEAEKHVGMPRMHNCLVEDSIPPRYSTTRWWTMFMPLLMFTVSKLLLLSSSCVVGVFTTVMLCFTVLLSIIPTSFVLFSHELHIHEGKLFERDRSIFASTLQRDGQSILIVFLTTSFCLTLRLLYTFITFSSLIW